MLSQIAEGLRLLEADYLGSSGSRGYGHVEICELKKRELKKDDSQWTEWENGGLQ
jgi:CRISPR/Cas system CSM-associated protein Csm3 (group 7 of RAMP superfamily)